jgi:hypothetical protein
VPVLEPGDAHEGRDADGERGRADLRRGVELHRAVLAVDEQKVKTAGLRDLRDIDGARLAQAQADGELARAQLPQGMVGDDGHECLSSHWDEAPLSARVTNSGSGP